MKTESLSRDYVAAPDADGNDSQYRIRIKGLASYGMLKEYHSQCEDTNRPVSNEP